MRNARFENAGPARVLVQMNGVSVAVLLGIIPHDLITDGYGHLGVVTLREGFRASLSNDFGL